MDRAMIGKCLRMNEDITTLSAARLLTVALQKLEAVLKLFAKAPVESGLWSQASSRLINLFVDRIPPLHELVTALQKVDADNEQMRTTVLECIATYLAILPASAATTKFDFGPVLAKAIVTLQSDSTDRELKNTVLEQSQHLVQIVNRSPTTKWFHKAASDDVSLIVQLIRFCVRDPQTPVAKQAFLVLKAVLSGKGIISDNPRSTEALLWSLSSTKKWDPELATFQFLDNCMARTMLRPVKYLDQLEQAQQLLSDSTELSLIACCAAEQWQYVVKKEDKKAIKNIGEWIARFFAALDVAGENYRVMHYFKDDMLEQCSSNEKATAVVEKAFEKQRKKPPILPELQQDGPEFFYNHSQVENAGVSLLQHNPTLDLNKVFPPAPPIPDSLAGLDRWAKPDFESEIQSGRLARLIRCLISPESEIRLQAFDKLQTVLHAVDQSTYEEKAQLYLLLGELCETVKAHNLATSGAVLPPSIVAELAIHFLPIISDPSSPFYRKTNTFLLRAPSWSIPHILTYWIKETFLTEPEIDDADIPFHVPQGGTGGIHNAQALEIDHLLDLLSRSLRTGEDMNLFRRAQVFTRLFSYYLAPIAPRHLRKMILGVVYRATTVEGGSDTLITRTGVREWLAIAKTVRGHSGQGVMFGKIDEEVKGWIGAVEVQIERTCDAEGIRRWEAERRILRQGIGAGGDSRGVGGREGDKGEGQTGPTSNRGEEEEGEAELEESSSSSSSGEDEESDGEDEDVDEDDA